MSVIAEIFERRSGTTLANPSQWLLDYFSGGSTRTGITVTESTALQFTAVYAAIRIISETVASLPLHVYRRLPGGGKERAREHPVYRLLHDRPNPYSTSFVVREALQGHILTWGNAYAEIERNNAGVPIAIWPLRPDRVSIEATEDGLIYVVQPEGKRIPGEDILHVPGLGFDGIMGYSPIRLAREAIGLGLAAERFGASFFGKGSRPSGVLTHPGKLSKDAVQRLRESWEALHKGVDNVGRIAILEEGVSWQQIGIPPEDAQFLQTRKFQVLEIARIYRIPPHMLGDLDRATFSNVEQQAIDFVVHTIRPWLVRWEQELNRKLFTEAEREIYFAEHLVDGLLRGDIKTRYEAYAKGRQWGWLSADDIRELENLNPLPDGSGKVYLVPLNMQPADALAQQPQQTKSAPPAAEMRSKAAEQERWLQARIEIGQAEEEVLRDVYGRLLRKELNAIRRAARKYLENSLQVEEFREWLKDFYKKFYEDILQSLTPPLKAYARNLRNLIAVELDRQDQIEGLAEFIVAYAESAARRYTGSGRAAILAIVRDAPKDEAFQQVTKRLDAWEQKRAQRVAAYERARAGNAFAREIYKGHGVRKLRWVTFGEESCPVCPAMDGKIIEIDQPFIRGGTSFDTEGAQPFVIERDLYHPPAHEGCECQIVPEE